MENKEMKKRIEKELEARLKSLKGKSCEEILDWIEGKFRNYYSNYIKDEDELNTITRMDIDSIALINYFTAIKLGTQIAVALIDAIITLLLIHEITNETVSPMEILFIATLETLRNNNYNFSYRI